MTNQEATMIALHRSFFAATALSLPLAIGTPTAHAGPALSELSDEATALKSQMLG